MTDGCVRCPKGTNLLLTVGELEQRLSSDTSPERAAFLTRARMVDNARDMAERGLHHPNLSVEFKESADENHGSFLHGAISRGFNTALCPPAGSASGPVEASAKH